MKSSILIRVCGRLALLKIRYKASICNPELRIVLFERGQFKYRMAGNIFGRILA